MIVKIKCTLDGLPIDNNSIWVVMNNMVKKLMINITPKSLRQACIFKWLSQRKSDSLIKEFMGVAPSYSLKPYKNIMANHPYSDNFVSELYYFYKRKH